MRIGIIIISALLLASCQKEFSVENGRNDLAGLLRRAEAVTNNDTLVTLYYYDNLSRLEMVVSDGISGQQTYHEYRKFTRDFTSRITNVEQQIMQGTFAYDTIRTVIHYADPVGLEYDYCVSTGNNWGSLTIDSTVFSFNGTRMMTNEVFTTIPDMAVNAALTERNEFTYDSTGNVEQRDYYTSISSTDGSILFTTTFMYHYDDKPGYEWHSVNAAQNYWLVGIPNLLNKNLKQIDVNDQTSTGQNVRILTTLTYGAGDKPVTGEVDVQPYNQKTSYKFYYQ